jgi:hypothetical protein
VITAVPGSPAAGLCDEELVLDFADETSVVQTRFPTTLLLLARAAVGESVDHLPEQCTGALAEPLPVDPGDVDHHVYLGRGWTLGLAHEAALKTREAAQAWAESYPRDGLPARLAGRGRPAQPRCGSSAARRWGWSTRSPRPARTPLPPASIRSCNWSRSSGWPLRWPGCAGWTPTSRVT